MSLLGLDVGTSGCKSVVTSSDGRTVASAARSYEPMVPQAGRLELDPETVWRAVCAATREVVGATTFDPPTSMAIGALGEAFVILDRKGRPDHADHRIG